MTRDQLKAMLEEQQDFFDEGGTLPVGARIKLLKSIRDSLKKNESRVYEALKKDLNKSEFEAYLGEFVAMMHEFETAIRKVRRWSRRKRIATPLLTAPAKSYKFPEPFGKVLIVAPWNYPFDLAFSPLAGAIAAGNTAIIKPSEFAPHSSQLISEIIDECCTRDKVRVVQGDLEVSKLLTGAPFDYIFFTGGIEAGKQVMKKAAERLTPLTLELGGKNPAIIDPLYPIEDAAKKISWGKFFNSGQSCVAPDYVLVHKDQEEPFIKAYERFSNQFMKNYETDYMKIVNERHFDRLISYFEQGEVVTGGKVDREKLIIWPTLVKPKSLQEALMQEEIFGPVLPIVTYEDKSDILAITRKLGKPLVVNLFSKRRKELSYWFNNTYSGNVCINDSLINYVNKNLPFGGVGESGIGAYHGKASFDLFSHYRSVIHKLPPDLRLRYPPYTWQLKVMKKIRKILNWGI